jgi:predicted acetyltransferase
MVNVREEEKKGVAKVNLHLFLLERPVAGIKPVIVTGDSTVEGSRGEEIPK